MTKPVIASLFALSLFAQTGAGPSWKVSYFHDEDQSQLTLIDIAAGPEKCAVAAGILVVKGRPKPVTVTTLDAGAHWTVNNLKEDPRSVFVLNDSLAWMVTDKGVSNSVDCGATWTRVSKQEKFLRVFFTTPDRGFAAGIEKRALTTTDGGKTWVAIPAAADLKADSERSAFSWIAFADEKFGLITGFHAPRRPEDAEIPDWMDPATAKRHRQWPALTLMLQTADGGANWKQSSSSILGRLTRLRLSTTGGLALVEFDKSFDWPSEVYRLALNGSSPTRLYREKNRAITDVVLRPDAAYLVGFEPPGSLHQLPIPGKVRVLRSTDLKVWAEMPVDYRAVARRVMVGYSGRGPVFAATDGGMILRLVE